MAAARTSPFVGREAELGALTSALGARPAVAIIEGPGGIGKTSVVERFLARDVRALWASGEEGEALVAFGVADQLVRRAGGGAVIGAGDHVTVGLRLLSLLDGDDAPDVLVVDDAHWADELSLRALLFAGRRLVAEPLLLVIVTRDAGLLPDGLRKLAATHLRLGPLSVEEIAALAAAVEQPLSAMAARRLSEHTGGYPLYARTLLDELPHETWLEAVLPVPRSYQDVIARRLQACTPEGRALVEAAAVLGLHPPLATAAAVAQLDAPLAALDEGVAAGLLERRERDDGHAVAFVHPLARAAVYHGLPAARRAALHERAAGVLEDPAAALRHRVDAAAGVDEPLAREAEAFARRELDRGAWASAVASLRAASRLSETHTERERRMLGAIDAMLYAGEGASARRLAAELTGTGDSAHREAVLAYLSIYAGDVADADARLTRAWDSGVTGDLAATVAMRRAFVASLRFRAPEIVEWAQRARALAPHDPKTHALTTTQLAVGLSLQGRRSEAHAALDTGLSGAVATGFPLRSVKGALLLGDDDLAAARPVLRAAAGEARRIGSLVIAAQSLALLAKLEFAAGAWDEAVVLADQAAALAVESGEAWALAFTRWAAMHVPLARGEPCPEPPPPRGAFERLAEVEACARAEAAAAAESPQAVLDALAPLLDGPVGFWRWQPLYAEALIDLNRDADAFLREHEGRWSASVTARLQRARGRLEAARRRPEWAQAAFEASLDTLAPLGMPYELALTEVAYGQFLRRRRRRREATTQLAAARERLAALGARPALERCERELAAAGLVPASEVTPPSGLTPQERAVARLVAAGHSNRRVADELLVSVRTVEAHLTRIYAKLEVGSRAELAATYANAREHVGFPDADT